MNRFLVVAVGRNCPGAAQHCLESIDVQDDPSWDLAVVDDASDTGLELDAVFDRFAWSVAVTNRERRYALANQVRAWQELEPEDEDVVVFVDLDDRLARPDALSIVRRAYDRGALMTYGSYRPVPADHPDARTCRPARPYPPDVVRTRGYRREVQWFNHLRTVSWSVLKHLTEEDLRNDEGNYWRAVTDRAVMFPSLELAGHRAAVVPEVLYEYTCDSPDAVWRADHDELVRESMQLRARPRKEPLP